MSMGTQNDPQQDHGSNENSQPPEHDDGHSGEGAASALAQMISQGRQRHQTGEAEDAAGSRHQ